MEQLNMSCMHDQMLESNRDDVKLEAMRCVTVMTAKGKLSVPRTLFPHIVKNVSSKNPELRKLIYLYLTNFADQEPDLALLPVATLQKSLKSPNPLVRSSALKVLTSMRLNILSAILMATLRNSVNDLSPYVRKTVAHSIIKIYRLDPTLQGDLIEYIERLLNDKNSMVLSSAVATFEVVCPDKLELVNKHFRRFCFILADCNEWGQTIFLKLLMRYVLYLYKQSEEGTLTDYNPSEHDPKILLRSAKPLVHSNNSAVVMAVIKLYIAIADHNEVRSTVTRPLIRLLNSHREIQLTVLKMIEELTAILGTPSGDQDLREDDDDIESVSSDDRASQHLNKAAELHETPTDDQNNQEQSASKDGYIAIDDPNDDSISIEHIGDTEALKDQSSAKETETDLGDEELTKENTVDGKTQDEINSESSDEDSGDEDSDDESDEDSDDDSAGTSEESDESTGHIANEKSENKDITIDLKNLESNKDPNAYREIFRPYIKSFFVKHTDCTQVRLEKLKILTNLSSSVNVNLVLRELQAYIAIYVEDKKFVSAAIQAIGRCAILVKEVAHTCLNGLTHLLSNNNEHVVSEAIVVLRSQIIDKKLSQVPTRNSDDTIDDTCNKSQSSNTGESKDNPKPHKNGPESCDGNDDDSKIVSTVIKQVTKLLPKVTAPQARATILWILAEFCDSNITAAKCAPEVLRNIAKSFCQEENFVKLQSLTLASKFLLSLDREMKAELHHKISLLAGYLFSLAKYDINHDVRDRGRFLKKLLDDEDLSSKVLNCHKAAHQSMSGKLNTGQPIS